MPPAQKLGVWDRMQGYLDFPGAAEAAAGAQLPGEHHGS